MKTKEILDKELFIQENYYNPENQYFLRLNNEKELIRSDHHTYLLSKSKHNHILKIHEYDENLACITLDNEALNKLSPTRINNKYFWKRLHRRFNMIAVCGNPNTADIHDLNQRTLTLLTVKSEKTYERLCSLFSATPKPKILEIGYGYGGFRDHLKEDFDIHDSYWGIDLVKRIEGENLYETNGWIIPKIIPNNLDIIYSMNVFQHLTQFQRLNYLKKGFKKLGTNGLFVFACFCETKENKDLSVWGVRDKEGRNYSQFFNQFIEVDTEEEIKQFAKELGYKYILREQIYVNMYTFVFQKP